MGPYNALGMRGNIPPNAKVLGLRKCDVKKVSLANTRWTLKKIGRRGAAEAAAKECVFTLENGQQTHHTRAAMSLIMRGWLIGKAHSEL